MSQELIKYKFICSLNAECGLDMGSLVPKQRQLQGYNVLHDVKHVTDTAESKDVKNIVTECVAFEVLEEVPNPDMIVVCCGGGGLLSGIASVVKLSSPSTMVYGVEPEGACTMYRSFMDGKPASMDAKSIAAGLAPPFAGTNTFRICKEHVEEVILVSDEEILEGVSRLYRAGFVVEPSGAAAYAAVLRNKIPDISGKTVIVFLTGGNLSPEELSHIFI